MLAADERIAARARELKAAGLEGGLDELRARALLDLLLGQDSRPAFPPASTQPRTPGRPAPAGFASRVTLTAPLATLTRLAARPGELSGLGPVDPWLTRDLATAAAQNPKTTWCLTVTDDQGHAVAHGCARPEPRSHRKRAGPARARAGVRLHPGQSATGRPDGYGSWRLQPRTRTGPDHHPRALTTDPCDHRHEAKGHDPGVKLRHLAQVRHATCTSPVCRRPAAQGDLEHNTPYEAGGRTCLCNTGPKCRHDHRLKQHPKWRGSTSSPTAPSGGRPRRAGRTRPNPPGTRSSLRRAGRLHPLARAPAPSPDPGPSSAGGMLLLALYAVLTALVFAKHGVATARMQTRFRGQLPPRPGRCQRGRGRIAKTSGQLSPGELTKSVQMRLAVR